MGCWVFGFASLLVAGRSPHVFPLMRRLLGWLGAGLGSQVFQPVQRALAGGPPLLLAHVRPLIPKAHAVLQALAATAGGAGRAFARARAGARGRPRRTTAGRGRRVGSR